MVKEQFIIVIIIIIIIIIIIVLLFITTTSNFSIVLPYIIFNSIFIWYGIFLLQIKLALELDLPLYVGTVVYIGRLHTSISSKLSEGQVKFYSNQLLSSQSHAEEPSTWWILMWYDNLFPLLTLT